MADDPTPTPAHTQTSPSKKPDRTEEEKAAARARSNANLRMWTKETAPRTAGRPAGIRERIRDLTNDGEDILKTWVDVMKNGQRERDRTDAAGKLAERLWGKPVETQVLVDATSAAASQLSLPPEALEALARALLPQATVRTLERGAEDAEAVAVEVKIPE